MVVHTGEPLIKHTFGRGRLVSAAVPWPDKPLLAVLARHADQPRSYWQAGGNSPAFAGIGASAVLTASGPGRFEQVRAQLDFLFDGASLPEDVPTEARPRVFGGFTFEADVEPRGIWSAFAPALFVLPRYQLSRFDGQTWLTINLLMDEGEVAQAETRLQDAMTWLADSSAESAAQVTLAGNLQVEYLTNSAEWVSMVSEAVDRIHAGALQKVVLARTAEVHAAVRIDPIAALAALDERFPDCTRFLVEPETGRAFFGATPEVLARIDGRRIETGALAGSIGRGATPLEDEELGANLLASPKNRHEHALVVDDITRRLTPLVNGLQVGDEPALRRLNNIQHLHTAISGELADSIDALHMVEALHPTPALGGTPRETACALIAELEPEPRGWYGAPVGWLDGQGSGHFAVAIRSAVSAGNTARLYSGAGIVGDSVPESEWQETALKFRPLLGALTGREQPK